MPKISKSVKLYFATGWTFWFLFRWGFYIGLFLLLFRIGGLPGSTFREKLQYLRPPKLLLIFPPEPIPLPPPPADLDVGYYTVVVSTATTREGAALIKGKLRESRIESEIIFANGQYIVTVGQFLTFKEASATLQKISRHGFSNARISGKNIL